MNSSIVARTRLMEAIILDKVTNVIEESSSYYRAILVVQTLGCVDLYVGSSPGWRAATVATTCLKI